MSTDTTTPPQQRRGYPPLSDLRRSRSDRKIAGVAGGLGRWAGIDPLVFRILFVVLLVFGGSGLLFYALGWLLVPEEGEVESEGQRLLTGGSTRSKGSVVALVIVIVAAVIGLSSVLGFGQGIGGLGVLAVIGLAALLLLRNGPRTGTTEQVYGPVPPPGGPGAYGQTAGTAYTAPAAPAAPAYPAAPVPETATFTPPPSPPAYPMYGPPAPPPPPRERSILGRVTLSVAVIVVGLLVGWNAATDSDVPARVVFAAALAVVGIGLVVGTVYGRSRWLVAWALLLTLLAAAAAAAPDVSVRGGFGDRTWSPTNVADLRPTYRLGIGDAELDLSALDLSGGGRERVEIRQGAGDLTVVVPDDVVVRIDADVDAGELRLPGLASVDGTDLAERVVVPEGSSPAAAVLVVDAHLGVGSLEVRRATS